VTDTHPKTSLTGIKPTNTPHLGNWVGAIKPALELANEYRTLYFIADYHALTTIHDATLMRKYTFDVAATWLACGLDPKKTILFLQSAIPEVFELTWVFGCVCATGQLERGHAYKDALAKGEAPNAGIFNYPLLMAADIVLYDTDVVPIGRDQKQHLELTRDLAARVNHVFGEGTLVVPEAIIRDAELLPGIDGQKMSKSYGNTLPLFAPANELRAAVMKIKTGSEPLEAPKDPASSTVFQIFSKIAPPADVQTMSDKLRAGGYGWGHAKQALFEALDARFGEPRRVYEELRADEARLAAILADGADRARPIAQATLSRLRRATGVGSE
jgi:tryptophanyl-tRNA synthetase